MRVDAYDGKNIYIRLVFLIRAKYPRLKKLIYKRDLFVLFFFSFSVLSKGQRQHLVMAFLLVKSKSS